MMAVVTRLFALLSLVLLALAGWAGFRLMRAEIEADVLRERLGSLMADYSALRDRYDAAVRRTAVTELVVEQGRLSVVVSTAEGTLREIETDLDPSREVYVDYVVIDGRLWIRRVFDDSVPPGQAIVIDPGLAEVDWSREGAAHGKAAYRRLDEGRWVVTVSGNGSLGLAPAPDAAVELAPPPAVREFAPVEDEARDLLGALGPVETARALARVLLP